MGPRLSRRRVFLLAAGRGTRAGGPKALKIVDGRTLIDRHLEFLDGLVAPGEVSVSVQAPWCAEVLAKAPTVRWVSVDPDASPLASLIALLKDRPDPEWGFVYHVDMPLWDPAVFESLGRRAETPGSVEAFVAACGGRRGHPALLSPALYPEILSLDPDKDRLDSFLRRSQTEAVETGRPTVLENLNF